MDGYSQDSQNSDLTFTATLQDNVSPTADQIEQKLKKLGASKSEIKMFLTAYDQATPRIKQVQEQMNRLPKDHMIQIRSNADEAQKKLGKLREVAAAPINVVIHVKDDLDDYINRFKMKFTHLEYELKNSLRNMPITGGLLSATSAAGNLLSAPFQALTGIPTAGVGAGAAGMVGASTALLYKSFQQNSQMEQNIAQLTTLLKTNSAAQSELRSVSNFSMKTPFNMSDVLQTDIRLRAIGVNPSNPNIGRRPISDLAAGAQVPMTQAEGAISAAKLGYFEQLNTITGRNVRQSDFQYGGRYTGQTYQQAIVDILKQFSGASQTQMQTFKGLVTNIQDVISQRFTRPIGESAFSAAKGLEVGTLGTLNSQSFQTKLAETVDKMNQGFIKFFDLIKQGQTYFKNSLEIPLTNIVQSVTKVGAAFGSAFGGTVVTGIKYLSEALTTVVQPLAAIAAKFPVLSQAAGMIKALHMFGISTKTGIGDILGGIGHLDIGRTLTGFREFTGLLAKFALYQTVKSFLDMKNANDQLGASFRTFGKNGGDALDTLKLRFDALIIRANALGKSVAQAKSYGAQIAEAVLPQLHGKARNTGTFSDIAYYGSLDSMRMSATTGIGGSQMAQITGQWAQTLKIGQAISSGQSPQKAMDNVSQQIMAAGRQLSRALGTDLATAVKQSASALIQWADQLKLTGLRNPYGAQLIKGLDTKLQGTVDYGEYGNYPGGLGGYLLTQAKNPGTDTISRALKQKGGLGASFDFWRPGPEFEGANLKNALGIFNQYDKIQSSTVKGNADLRRMLGSDTIKALGISLPAPSNPFSLLPALKGLQPVGQSTSNKQAAENLVVIGKAADQIDPAIQRLNSDITGFNNTLQKLSLAGEEAGQTLAKFQLKTLGKRYDVQSQQLGLEQLQLDKVNPLQRAMAAASQAMADYQQHAVVPVQRAQEDWNQVMVRTSNHLEDITFALGKAQFEMGKFHDGMLQGENALTAQIESLGLYVKKLEMLKLQNMGLQADMTKTQIHGSFVSTVAPLMGFTLERQTQLAGYRAQMAQDQYDTTYGAKHWQLDRAARPLFQRTEMSFDKRMQGILNARSVIDTSTLDTRKVQDLQYQEQLKARLLQEKMYQINVGMRPMQDKQYELNKAMFGLQQNISIKTDNIARTSLAISKAQLPIQKHLEKVQLATQIQSTDINKKLIPKQIDLGTLQDFVSRLHDLQGYLAQDFYNNIKINANHLPNIAQNIQSTQEAVKAIKDFLIKDKSKPGDNKIGGPGLLSQIFNATTGLANPLSLIQHLTDAVHTVGHLLGGGALATIAGALTFGTAALVAANTGSVVSGKVLSTGFNRLGNKLGPESFLGGKAGQWASNIEGSIEGRLRHPFWFPGARGVEMATMFGLGAAGQAIGGTPGRILGTAAGYYLGDAASNKFVGWRKTAGFGAVTKKIGGFELGAIGRSLDGFVTSLHHFNPLTWLKEGSLVFPKLIMENIKGPFSALHGIIVDAGRKFAEHVDKAGGAADKIGKEGNVFSRIGGGLKDFGTRMFTWLDDHHTGNAEKVANHAERFAHHSKVAAEHVDKVAKKYAETHPWVEKVKNGAQKTAEFFKAEQGSTTIFTAGLGQAAEHAVKIKNLFSAIGSSKAFSIGGGVLNRLGQIGLVAGGILPFTPLGHGNIVNRLEDSSRNLDPTGWLQGAASLGSGLPGVGGIFKAISNLPSVTGLLDHRERDAKRLQARIHQQVGSIDNLQSLIGKGMGVANNPAFGLLGGGVASSFGQTAEDQLQKSVQLLTQGLKTGNGSLIRESMAYYNLAQRSEQNFYGALGNIRQNAVKDHVNLTKTEMAQLQSVQTRGFTDLIAGPKGLQSYLDSISGALTNHWNDRGKQTATAFTNEGQTHSKGYDQIGHITGGALTGLKKAIDDWSKSMGLPLAGNKGTAAPNSISGSVSSAAGSITSGAVSGISNLINFASGGLVHADKHKVGMDRGRIVRMVEEGHPEVVIPLAPHRRDRAKSLLKQTQGMLGMAAGGYVFPFSGSGWGTSRTDQGKDFFGSAPVGAIGPATVTYSNPKDGWYGPAPAFMVYQLTGGPKKGAYVYVAEHLANMAPQGTKVNAGQAIAQMTGGIEMGWAAGPKGHQIIQSMGANHLTSAGTDFADFLTGLAHGKITGGLFGTGSGGQTPINLPTIQKLAAALKKHGIVGNHLFKVLQHARKKWQNHLNNAGATSVTGPAHPGNAQQKAIVAAAAKKWGIDPSFLWGVYGTETSFGTNLSTSSTGAQGYFQFEPATAKAYGVNPYDFTSSAYGAAHLLSTGKAGGPMGMVNVFYGAPSQSYLSNVEKYAKQYAGGLGRVPYDNFPAMLHKDERVLSAGEVHSKGQDNPVLAYIKAIAENTKGSNDILTKLNDAQQKQLLLGIEQQIKNAGPQTKRLDHLVGKELALGLGMHSGVINSASGFGQASTQTSNTINSLVGTLQNLDLKRVANPGKGAQLVHDEKLADLLRGKIDHLTTKLHKDQSKLIHDERHHASRKIIGRDKANVRKDKHLITVDTRELATILKRIDSESHLVHTGKFHSFTRELNEQVQIQHRLPLDQHITAGADKALKNFEHHHNMRHLSGKAERQFSQLKHTDLQDHRMLSHDTHRLNQVNRSIHDDEQNFRKWGELHGYSKKVLDAALKAAKHQSSSQTVTDKQLEKYYLHQKNPLATKHSFGYQGGVHSTKHGHAHSQHKGAAVYKKAIDTISTNTHDANSLSKRAEQHRKALLSESTKHHHTVNAHFGHARDHFAHSGEHFAHAKAHYSGTRDHFGHAREHYGYARNHFGASKDHFGVTRDHLSVAREHALSGRQHLNVAMDHVNVARDHLSTTKDARDRATGHYDRAKKAASDLQGIQRDQTHHFEKRASKDDEYHDGSSKHFNNMVNHLSRMADHIDKLNPNIQNNILVQIDQKNVESRITQNINTRNR